MGLKKHKDKEIPKNDFKINFLIYELKIKNKTYKHFLPLKILTSYLNNAFLKGL